MPHHDDPEKLQEALQPNVRRLLALDDWHPNYGPNRAWVKARIIKLRPEQASTPGANYRVLVSGADDFRLVRDDLAEEQAKYLLEKLPPLITKQAVYDLGFATF
jgi:hypothetical protein